MKKLILALLLAVASPAFAVQPDEVLDDPAPWTGVTGLLDSAVQITLQAWVKAEDWWQIQADLMQAGWPKDKANAQAAAG